MIDRGAKAGGEAPGGAVGSVALERVLPTAAAVGTGPRLMRRIDELHLERRSTGRASSPSSCGGKATMSAGDTCDTDAPDGDRSAVPQAAHQHPGTRGARSIRICWTDL